MARAGTYLERLCMCVGLTKVLAAWMHGVDLGCGPLCGVNVPILSEDATDLAVTPGGLYNSLEGCHTA